MDHHHLNYITMIFLKNLATPNTKKMKKIQANKLTKKTPICHHVQLDQRLAILDKLIWT